MHGRTLRLVLQLQQLHPAIHKLQLRSWKILEAAAAANPFGILHKN